MRIQLKQSLGYLVITALAFVFLGILGNPVTASALNCPSGTTASGGKCVTNPATPAAKGDVCAGIGATTTTGDCTTTSGSPSISGIVATVVNILSVIAGVAAVIMIIIGGLRYITSGGDSNSVSAAKKTIIYAIVGLIVVALAQGIVRFTVGKLK